MAQKKFIIDGGFQVSDDSVINANLEMGGSILPAANVTYDLGSPTLMWKDIYVGPGSLYVDGQKVLESDSGTINVTADQDQSLTVKTSGTGVLTLQSDTTINFAGNFQMSSGSAISSNDGTVTFSDKVDLDNNQMINVGSPTSAGHAATKGYVDQELSNLINGAPGALDTLNELANAIGDDANFASTMTTALASKASITYVDAEVATVAASASANATAIATANVNITNNATAIATANTNITNNATAIASNATAISAETANRLAEVAAAVSSASADATAKANAAQAAAEATAEAYTDAREAAITTAYQAAVSSAVSSAEPAGGYAGETYVDSEVATAKAAAIAAAAADATTKANAAEADAVATAAADATSKANAAQVAAISSATATASADATSKANAAEAAAVATAESYTDAEVSAEATARATAVANAVATASADATSKADAAEAAAIASATATASADATSKANAAQAAAISSANSYTDTKVAAVISGAPGALDTLNELAAALGDDANFASTITNSVATKVTTGSSEYIKGATVSNDTITFTRGDNSTFAVTTSDANSNTYVTGASFNTGNGVLTLSRNSGSVTVDLDGRYQAAGSYQPAGSYASTSTTISAGNGLTGGGNLTANRTLNVGGGNGISVSADGVAMSGSFTGSFTATGDITAYSDDSLKTNVQVIDGALGRVEQIRGVTFERIEDGSVSTGVIAQELEAVLPEAVKKDEDGVRHVAYGNITGLLIEAVKELSAQVEELKKNK